MVFDAKRKTTLCCSYCTNWSRLQSIWRRRIESPAKISALLIRFINHSEIRLRFWRAPFPFLFLILKSSFYEKIAGSIMIALSNCRETNSYANVTTSKPKALWSINISGEKRKEKGIGICQLISRIKRQAFGICAWTARKEHRKGSRPNNLSDSKSGATLIKHKEWNSIAIIINPITPNRYPWIVMWCPYFNLRKLAACLCHVCEDTTPECLG